MNIYILVNLVAGGGRQSSESLCPAHAFLPRRSRGRPSFVPASLFHRACSLSLSLLEEAAFLNGEERAMAGSLGLDEEGTIDGERERGGTGRLHRRSRWSKLCWWPALALTHSIAHSILGREASQTTSDPTSTWKGAASPRNGNWIEQGEKVR